jgi:hypothetical protein
MEHTDGFARMTSRTSLNTKYVAVPSGGIFCLKAVVLLLIAATIPGLAQTDPLSGKWDGKSISPQGERPTSMTFKKEADAYTGTKDVKLDGNKLTATAAVEGPQGSITLKFNLTLDGETLKGKGEVDLGGQSIPFEVELKRGAAGAAGASAAGPGAAGAGRQREQRPQVPQPMQAQTVDYFVGSWSVKFVGRESPFGAAPREGTITFVKNPDGTLTGKGVSTYQGGSLEETITVSFDEAKKTLTFLERRSNGLQFTSKGDWSSPIAIRFTIGPFRIGERTLALKRTLTLVSAHSFRTVEEISEDGEPFVRLGNGVWSKVNN